MSDQLKIGAPDGQESGGVASGGVPASPVGFKGNKTIGRIKTFQCSREEMSPPPEARHELKPWDGVTRGSPAEEYLKQTPGGLDPVRGDSFHYQASLGVQDAAIGEGIGAMLGKVLQLGGKMLGAARQAIRPEAPKPVPAKPASPGNGLVVVKPKTNHEKAAFGEKTAHDKMTQKGHEPVGKTDGVYEPGKTGIDGVYKNANPPPDYIVTEVKYGSAQLEKGLADGTNQMDDAWVKKRLVDKVGLEEAEKISSAMNKPGGVEKWLVHVGEDGSSTATKINSSGSPIRGKAGKIGGF